MNFNHQVRAVKMKRWTCDLKYRSVRAGSIAWIDSIKDGAGARVSRRFIRRILTNLCVESFKYWQWDPDYYPLTYPERHWYSHFALAVAKTGAYHLSEHAIRRRTRTEDPYAGRVDLWANFSDTQFFFELKRETFGYRNAEWPTKLKHSTKSAIEQARSLRHETKEWVGNSVVIGLCLVVPYSIFEIERARDEVDENAGQTFLRTAAASFPGKRLANRPNFAAIWIPPTSAQTFKNEDKDGKLRHEHIPFIGFLGQVDTSACRMA